MGLHRAGFDVIGIDIKPQPRYPFRFVQASALQPPFDLSRFDFIWASPPCQAHTALKTMYNAKHHEDLVPPTRALLKECGKPYVIENVVGAPVRPDIILCGTMFGLGTGDAELRRHRLFEINWTPPFTSPCNHSARRTCEVYGGHGHDKRRVRPNTVGVWGKSGGYSVRDGVQQFSIAERSEAMDIDWMTGAELSQAIPPAYSEFIGKAALQQMELVNG